MNEHEIIAFLQRLGERVTKPSEIYVLGGSALVLLGGSRPTIEDIVFLVQNGFVKYEGLESMMKTAVQQSGRFDLDPIAMSKNLEIVLKRLE